jgi:hypothetical protein
MRTPESVDPLSLRHLPGSVNSHSEEPLNHLPARGEARIGALLLIVLPKQGGP